MKEPRSAYRTEPGQYGSGGALTAYTRLLQLLVGICVALLVAVAAGGYILYHEIAALDRKVSLVQRSTQAGIERVTTLTSGNATGIVTLLKAHGGIEQQLARIEAAAGAKQPAPAATPITDLTPTETAGLRTLFNLARNANASPRYKVGDKIAAAEVKPLPDNVIQAYPRLKSMNFLIDQNGALVITAGADNTIVLIVEPS